METLPAGDEGPGRLIELENIVDYVNSLNTPKLLARKKVLISSGPTWEPIDPVRGITNRSSGKMGAALARGAWLAGAQVTVVSGPAAAMLPGAVKVIRVYDRPGNASRHGTGIRKRRTLHHGRRGGRISGPGNTCPKKKHRDQNAPWNIELISNPDIAEHLAGIKTAGFWLVFPWKLTTAMRGIGKNEKEKTAI